MLVFVVIFFSCCLIILKESSFAWLICLACTTLPVVYMCIFFGFFIFYFASKMTNSLFFETARMTSSTQSKYAQHADKKDTHVYYSSAVLDWAYLEAAHTFSLHLSISKLLKLIHSNNTCLHLKPWISDLEKCTLNSNSIKYLLLGFTKTK